jgi:hypothetical protein
MISIGFMTKLFTIKTFLNFFLKNPYIHHGNTLLVDDTLYKCYRNPPFDAIFVQSYEKQKVKRKLPC